MPEHSNPRGFSRLEVAQGTWLRLNGVTISARKSCCFRIVRDVSVEVPARQAARSDGRSYSRLAVTMGVGQRLLIQGGELESINQIDLLVHEKALMAFGKQVIPTSPGHSPLLQFLHCIQRAYTECDGFPETHLAQAAQLYKSADLPSSPADAVWQAVQAGDMSTAHREIVSYLRRQRPAPPGCASSRALPRAPAGTMPRPCAAA